MLGGFRAQRFLENKQPNPWIDVEPIVRERLQRAARPTRRQSTPLDTIADLIGSVDGLPADLSARKKRYLKVTGYGQKRAR